MTTVGDEIIKQDKFDEHLAKRVTSLGLHKAIAEGAQQAADAAQESADDADRTFRREAAVLTQFLDAARAKFPDLTVPTFEDVTKDLEEYR
jgi:hypothetical protein